MTAPHAELIRRHFDTGAIRFGGLTLNSGITSPSCLAEGKRAGLADGPPIRPSRKFLPTARFA